MLLSIAKLAAKHGIAPLKKYGQNFIFDESLCDKIVKYSVSNNSTAVLEIGPGTAGLTRSILKSNPKNFFVIETDERCIPLLEEIKGLYSVLQIIHGDALKISLSEITNEKLDIIANLPYNIGTQILTNYLYQLSSVNSITVMLQKEVVDRITSVPDSKTYGRLSVFCQILCNVEKCFDVSPKAFYPEPKVHSSIVRLVPKIETISANMLKKVELITHHAFIARRKMIKSSLKNLIPNINEVLGILNLSGSLRAENLSPEDYLRIAERI